MNNADKPINPVMNSDGFATSFENIDGADGGATGLTKREHFAGLAMQGLLSNNLIIGHGSDEIQWVAKHAILQADELLKQLEK